MKDIMFLYRVRLLSGQTVHCKSKSMKDVVEAESFWVLDPNGNLEQSGFMNHEGRFLTRSWGCKPVVVEELPSLGLIRDCNLIVRGKDFTVLSTDDDLTKTFKEVMNGFDSQLGILNENIDRIQKLHKSYRRGGYNE